jgi:long-chain acyl-CoA synthetase
MQLLTKQRTTAAGGVLGLMQLKAASYGKRPAVSWSDGGTWQQMTFAEIADKARQLSNYLIETGLRPGDRVAILSESSPEWGITLFAIFRSGGILVPLDPKLSASELTNIVADAQPRLLFASPACMTKAKAVHGSLTNGSMPPAIFELSYDNKSVDIQTLSRLKAKSEQEGVDREPDETAVIVYTSGTMGKPKGVMITFGNLIFEIQNLQQMFGSTRQDVFLSILPMNHLLELTGGFLGALYNGGQVAYCNSIFPQDVGLAMRRRKVTLMFTVPMFLKMLKNNIEREIDNGGLLTTVLFNFAFSIAQLLPCRWLRKLLFWPIHSKLGGRLRGFVSGGAPLDPVVAEFFNTIGAPVYQGYGLTETSPVVTANNRRHFRVGSVGKPLPGVEVCLLKDRPDDEEGEILTRGPHVMSGYYNRQELTRRVLDHDGWLHTGDIGRFDRDGFLYITGRTKNLIVLGGGKKVHPEEIEHILQDGKTIKEVAIIGRVVQDGINAGNEEVCAIVVPADDVKQRFNNNVPEMASAIMREFDKILFEVAPFKRPTRIFIHNEQLPLTATCKVKRQMLAEWIERQGIFSS